MKEYIGGYFEWEFPKNKTFEIHSNSVLLNSGTHALEYILNGLHNISKVYVAKYTCYTILQPLDRLGIPYDFYNIDNNLEISRDISITESEYVIYTNYYGIKDGYVENLFLKYGENLIIDNAQALFCKAMADHQFYSPRKFIGIPDGGIAITSVKNYVGELPLDYSNERCQHLLKRIELKPIEGHKDFKRNDKSVFDDKLRRMSNLSEHILASTDFDFIKEKRLENFLYLNDHLYGFNEFTLPRIETFQVPMYYPLLTHNTMLKSKLMENNVFIATYWPNVFEWCKENEFEYYIAQNMVCLPIDQRYGIEEMKKIVYLVSMHLNRE